MAKLRSVSTAFWSDPFVEDLTPSEKLLFIYLITNEKTNMLGIYEASIKKISFETGINKPDIEKALKGFESLGKVKYINNYVILVNYMKHQHFNTNMKKSAIDVYNSLPKELKSSDLAISKSNPSEGFERLLNHYGMVRKIEVEDEVEVKVEDELEEELEEEETKGDKPLSPKKSIQELCLIRESKFKEDVNAFTDYDSQTLNAFFNYWSEPNKSKSKMLWETKPTFDIKRRLVTWASKSFNNTSNGSTTRTETRADEADRKLLEDFAKL